MLSIFSEVKAQTSCRDSLRASMQHGRVLVRNIALRDSLLAVRLQTISILKTQNVNCNSKNDSLLKSNLLLGNKLKKRRTERNALGFLFIISVGLLLIL